jgi:hypothetical protein
MATRPWLKKADRNVKDPEKLALILRMREDPELPEKFDSLKEMRAYLRDIDPATVHGVWCLYRGWRDRHPVVVADDY